MNKKYLTNGLLGCVMALGLVCTTSAQNMVAGKAKVIRLSGRARFTTGNNVWQPVKMGDVFGAGTIIQTDQAKGSYVDLVLVDANVPVASGYANGPEVAPIT